MAGGAYRDSRDNRRPMPLDWSPSLDEAEGALCLVHQARDVVDHDAVISLLHAVQSGDVAKAVELADAGLDVNTVCPSFTIAGLTYMGRSEEFATTFRSAVALHVAVYFRRPACVAALLARGADIGVVAHDVRFHLSGEPELCKWRYVRVNALHLAVSGEECVSDAFGSPVEARQTLKHLLDNIRAHMPGLTKAPEVPWSAERVRDIVDSHAHHIEWWFRGRPWKELRGLTPLHLSIFFTEAHKTDHGLDAARDLVGLVHANRDCVRFDAILEDGLVYAKRLTARELCAKCVDEEWTCISWDLRLLEACRAATRKVITELLAARNIGDDLGVHAMSEPTLVELAQSAERAAQETRHGWLASTVGALAASAVEEEVEDEYTKALSLNGKPRRWEDWSHESLPLMLSP